MKRKLTSYFAGVLTALVLGTITMSAFAAGGVLTLTVTPIRVMVNGQVFQPRVGAADNVAAIVHAYEKTGIIRKTSAFIRTAFHKHAIGMAQKQAACRI